MAPLRDDPEYRPKWEKRRAVIFGTLILDAVVLLFVFVCWAFLSLEVNAPLATVVVSTILRDTAIVASYVFGATWEDIRLWQS